MRTPLGRCPASPALALLRATAFRPVDAAWRAAWAPRLAAGGAIREAARARDLRRALPHLGRAIEAAQLGGRLPVDERAILAAARLFGAASAGRLAATLDPLGAACRVEGVVPLLLKGAALHGALHPDPADRPVSDADLYVPFEAWSAMARALRAAELEPDRLTAARVDALERSAGRTSLLSDFVFRRRDGKGVPVEVKFDPVQLGAPLRRGAAFAEGATPSARYEGFAVPAPEAMAVQQALHLARHDGSDALWIAELAHGIARAAARGAFSPARALALIEGEGLATVLRAVLAAAEEMFPGTVPVALRRGATGGPAPAILRRSPRAPGAADERRATLSLQAFHAVTSRRALCVVRSLVARLRPSDAYVAARLGLAPGTPIGGAHRRRRFLYLFRGARAEGADR